MLYKLEHILLLVVDRRGRGRNQGRGGNFFPSNRDKYGEGVLQEVEERHIEVSPKYNATDVNDSDIMHQNVELSYRVISKKSKLMLLKQRKH